MSDLGCVLLTALAVLLITLCCRDEGASAKGRLQEQPVAGAPFSKITF
jgi:hypothetical protein